MEKLKPCPFCGGKASARRLPYSRTDEDAYIVFCDNRDGKCLAEPCTNRFDTREKAIEVWNKRAD